MALRRTLAPTRLRALVATLLLTGLAASPAQAQGGDPPLTGTISPTAAYAVPNHNGIQLYWNDTVENERGFLVYRDNGVTTQLVNDPIYCPISTPNITGCYDITRMPNTIFRYYIYAWNNSGSLYAGTYVAGRTPSGSESPTIRGATATGPHTVKVEWEDLSFEETGYEVYRAVSGAWQLEGTFPPNPGAFLPNTTTATITNPAMDATAINVFAVASLSAFGVTWSDTYIYSLPFAAPNGVLAAPSDIWDVHAFTSQGIVGWADNSTDEDGFVVYRSDGASFTQVCVAPANSTQCLFSEPEKQPGEYISYFVYAYKGSSLSPAGIRVVHRPDRLDPPMLSGATGLSSNTILLTWTGLFGSTAYDVLEYLGGSLVLVGSTTESYFVATGLAPGTTHVYVVVARTATKTSAPSKYIYATTRT
jgi:hypothetical protein